MCVISDNNFYKMVTAWYFYAHQFSRKNMNVTPTRLGIADDSEHFVFQVHSSELSYTLYSLRPQDTVGHCTQT